MESDEIVGHVLKFLAHVLAPMMQSGEIASIDLVYTSEPRNSDEGILVLGGGIEIFCFYQTCGCKKKKQNIRTAIRNAAL